MTAPQGIEWTPDPKHPGLLRRPGAIRWVTRGELAAWENGESVTTFDPELVPAWAVGLRKVAGAWVREAA